jgi:hypothetical protein
MGNRILGLVGPDSSFSAIIDAVLGSLRPIVEARAGSRPRLEVAIAAPLPIDAVWLPDLGVWLPGSWANISIAGKAVKSDDAEVEQYPWNQRTARLSHWNYHGDQRARAVSPR